MVLFPRLAAVQRLQLLVLSLAVLPVQRLQPLALLFPKSAEFLAMALLMALLLRRHQLRVAH